MRVLARVPIRLRLTLVFAAAMAAVLAAMGVFLYLRLAVALDRTIDQGLRSRAGDVAALVQEDSGLGDQQGPRLNVQDRVFAQVVEPGGRVLDSSPALAGRALLGGDQLARAAGGTIMVDRPPFPGSDDPVRVLATPVATEDHRLLVVAVGASLEERAEALESLRDQLMLGGPAALLLSSLVAYAVAAAALRPVESMRREAEAVSAAEPGRRLPLPPADDEVFRLGETLNSMLARLEAAFAREQRFVSDASHELRTPLAALRTELELALRRTRTREELEAALRSAAEESERLSQLAEDLLVLARSHGGRLPVRRERLAAAELLDGVRERYARRAAEARRPLETRVEDGLELSVDRLRAEQALGNLVENALRHGRGRILVDARGRADRVELHVRDEGPGFSPEFVERAFEPFTRDDPARLGPGAGLGLAIVDVIARAHGGAAHVANRDGGADAWLELPAAPARPAAESPGAAN